MKLSDVRQGEAVHADRIRAAEERAARSEKYIRAMVRGPRFEPQ